MPTPQPMILPEPGEHARFVILSAAGPAPELVRHLARFPELLAEVARLDQSAGLVAGVGIGPSLWKALSPQAKPRHLRAFTAIDHDGRSAPSTGGDLLLHIVSQRADLNAELLLRTMRKFAGATTVVEDVQGFRYLSRAPAS